MSAARPGLAPEGGAAAVAQSAGVMEAARERQGHLPDSDEYCCLAAHGDDWHRLLAAAEGSPALAAAVAVAAPVAA